MKKFLLILGMVTCLAGMTACGETSTTSNLLYTEEDIADAPESLLEFVDQVVAAGQETQAIAAYPELEDAVSGWSASVDEIGTILSFDGKDIEMGTDEATVTLKVSGSLHDANVVIVYDEQGSVASFSVNVIKPMGELMTNAALNTLLGLGTVFVVLILIACLIYCFKFISVFEKKMADKKAKETPAPTPAPVVAAAPVVEEVAEEDDCELVAVIAAAIAASEGATSTDGFVVRSIKRRSGKWQKA